MPGYSFEGRVPRIDQEAFIAPTATLIGDVTVEAGASVWFNTVLRADFAPIVIRADANVQDGSVLHAQPGIPVDIGPGATIGHACVVHGAHIGADAVVANHATVLDGVIIGARSLVAAHALVVPGTKIPDEVVVGIIEEMGDLLDHDHLDRWAPELGVVELLAQARAMAVPPS